MKEPRLEALRVMRAPVSHRAALHPNGKPDAQLSAGHIMQFGPMVYQLIHGQSNEINEHHFYHRAESQHCRANRQSNNRPLAYRGVDDSILAKLLSQPLGNTKGLAEQFGENRVDRKST